MTRFNLLPLLAVTLLGAAAPPASSSKPLVESRIRSAFPILTPGQVPALPKGANSQKPNLPWLESMQATATQTRLPAFLVGDEVTSVKGTTPSESGWAAFLLTVPAEQKVMVRLEHPKASAFRLEPLNEFAASTALAMLGSQGGAPTLHFHERGLGMQVLVVVVQDPGRHGAKEPYLLTFQRSWNATIEMPKSPKDSRVWGLLPLPEVP